MTMFFQAVDDGPVPPTPTSWTKAQLMDIQGDLMIWCPEVKPTFNAEGYDPELRIFRRGDNGAIAHGIEAGYVWTVWLWRYPPAKREIIYRAILGFKFTHCAIEVVPEAGLGYHSLAPMTDEEVATFGTTMNVIHDELVAHGIIPICAGVSPTQPVAPGFDVTKALIAMDDWDNTAQKDCQIATLHKTFPKALCYVELPGDWEVPQPDLCSASPFPPGGTWCQQNMKRFPRFVGVMYETNWPDGLDVNAAQLAKRHDFFRDVQEVDLEVDTYWKFWNGNDVAEQRTYNDALQARCPWLMGFMSGSTAHPPIPTPPTPPPVGELDLSLCRLIASPADLASRPITTKIERLELRQDGVHLVFSGQDTWPSTADSPEMGPLQYTLGLAMKIGDQWYAATVIQFWKDLEVNGGNVGDASVANAAGQMVGQIAANWFYPPTWNPMDRQPAEGETVGFFVVAGNTRLGMDDCPVRERSNVVLVPMPSAAGATFQF